MSDSQEKRPSTTEEWTNLINLIKLMHRTLILLFLFNRTEIIQYQVLPAKNLFLLCDRN